MPVGVRKNLLYGMALPLLGKRCAWKTAQRYGTGDGDRTSDMVRVFRRNHVVGGCVQRFRRGALAEGYCAGFASLNPRSEVTPDTFFRTASVAKMVCALLVMRLQTLGKLDVHEDISDLWGTPIRNPNFSDTAISLHTLLSHTSGMVDSPLYFSSYQQPVPMDALLTNPGSFAPTRPGEHFRYSNFAAGLIGCLLERRMNESLETLARRELFEPLQAQATFDISTLRGAQIADSYRVLPAAHNPAFHAAARLQTALPLDVPDPQTHYLLASGSLFVTGEGLARLCLPLLTNAHDGWLSATSQTQMKTPVTSWPGAEARTRHGMGLLVLDDPSLFHGPLYGHQGIAYGAVNGVFFDTEGNGFVVLNSGASERREGHLSCLNRDLIHCLIAGEPDA